VEAMMASAMAVTVEMAEFLAMRFGHFGGLGGGGGLFLGLLAIGGVGLIVWAVTRGEKTRV
jgi:hypothetical protein